MVFLRYLHNFYYLNVYKGKIFCIDFDNINLKTDENPPKMHLQLTYRYLVQMYLLDQLTLHLPVYMHTRVF